MTTDEPHAVEREAATEKRRLTRLFGSDDEAAAQTPRVREEDSARADESAEDDGASGEDVAETTTIDHEVDYAGDTGQASEALDTFGEVEPVASEAETESLSGSVERAHHGEITETATETVNSALTAERSLSPASTSEDLGRIERLRFAASVVQLYRYKGDENEYASVGAAGLAILDHDGALSRDLLVYDVSKRPLVRRKIDHRLSCELQSDNYVTMKYNGVILFSALMRDECEWLAVGAEITIAHYIARRRSEGFFTDSLIMDVSTPIERRAQLALGDSARVNYEAVRGGGSSSFLEPDVLAFKLIDETSERVEGAKVKLELDSTVPSAVVEGLVGCSRDSRRLILAPKSETEFVLYDVTVTRIKKQTHRNNGSPGRSNPLDDPSALSIDQTPVGPSQTPGASQDTPLISAPPQHTPPSPQLFTSSQSWAIPMPMSPSDVAVISDVRRAVSDLSDEVLALAVRARQGGTWIPPAPTGELKRAIDELTKARRIVMLPAIDALALSMSDIKQLTVEAERLAELQDELREHRNQARERDLANRM